ncbi:MULTISPECIES: hypothetical protein [unclassified Geobacillus]|uniref:hypothetical protein n=1 Tax=Geobacillus TaxID=129337 RepID=UPI0009BAB425|nr:MULTISPECIES: hypothetical protein [unclassified Geobacillus]MCG6794891.1 hypothetical protein [Geobacillus sp. YHL]
MVRHAAAVSVAARGTLLIAATAAASTVDSRGCCDDDAKTGCRWLLAAVRHMSLSAEQETQSGR